MGNSKEEWQKKNPINRIFYAMKFRCNHPTQPYYKRGIKCFLTMEDLRFLWDRDGASTMKRPSIDRIDGKGNYEINNCRFIELTENTRRGRAKAIEQYSLKGKFIKRFDTIYQAALAITKKQDWGTNISNVAKGRKNSAYGYKWKFVEEI